MPNLSRYRPAFIASFAALALWLVSALAASAQTPAALPTAPGADRAVTAPAPASAAKASLPGDNGSPLEPYLFTFLLAGGGIICAIAVRVTNARLVSGYASEKRYTR